MIDFNTAAPGDKVTTVDGTVLTVFNVVRPNDRGQAFNGLQFRADGITWAYTVEGVCENDSEMDLVNYVQVVQECKNLKTNLKFMSAHNLSNNMYFCTVDDLSQDVVRYELLVKDGEVFTRATVKNIMKGMHGCLWARAWNKSALTLLDVALYTVEKFEDGSPKALKIKKRILHFTPFSNRLGPRKLRGQHESDR